MKGSIGKVSKLSLNLDDSVEKWLPVKAQDTLKIWSFEWPGILKIEMKGDNKQIQNKHQIGFKI